MNKGIISALSAVTGAAIGAGAAGKAIIGEKEKAKSMSDKHLALFLMMNQWVRVKQEGKNLSEYFERNGYKKIAIYGMSYAGEALINELKDTSIEVAYCIDKNANSIYADVNVFLPEDDFDAVDAVVITAITFFDEIVEKLSGKMQCPFISLEEILYEV